MLGTDQIEVKNLSLISNVNYLKATLKNKMKIEVSTRKVDNDDCCYRWRGMLHGDVYRTKDGLVSNLVESIEYFLNETAFSTDVYLIFDIDYINITSNQRHNRKGLANLKQLIRCPSILFCHRRKCACLQPKQRKI